MTLDELTERTSQVRPSDQPDVVFTYIDIGSVDNLTKKVVNPQRLRGCDAPSRARRLVRAGDVIVSMTRPNLNAVALIGPDLDGAVASTGFAVLRPRAELLSDYLFLVVQTPAFVDRLTRLTAGQMYPAVSEKDIRSTPMSPPPPHEQREIVDLLSRANGLKQLAEVAQTKARELVPALFHDMFGDPAVNRSGWPVMPLMDVADIRSGITKGRKARGTTRAIPYLRVANVQDGALDLESIKHIDATEEEIRRYALADGDLLLTEGGDPDKLGRTALWRSEVDECIHQNHVFAVRVLQDRLVPSFAAAVTGSAYGKAYFLSVAKRTTGIASINKTQLGRFPMLVPPLAMQRDFAARAQEVMSIARLAAQAASTAELTSAALVSRLLA